MATTKHTCNDGNGPVFGRKTAGCPRCDELLGGAAPVVWASLGLKKRNEAMQRLALKEHNCTRSGCGPVCTFGDW
jgi:hypothetical protein